MPQNCSEEKPDVLDSPSRMRKHYSKLPYRRSSSHTIVHLNAVEELLGDYGDEDFIRIDAAISNNRFPFLALPKDIQVLVLYMVDVLDLLSISQTCKEIHVLCKHECIWRHQVTKKWGDLITFPTRWREYLYLRTAFITCKGECLTWKCKNVSENELPSARQSLSACVVNSNVYYVGGQTSITSRFDDIFVFNTDTRRFYQPLTHGRPPRFARHTAVSVGPRLYLFGGFDGIGTFFGLQIYDTDTNEWTHNPAEIGERPIPRTNHAVASVDHSVFLFGGNDTTNPQLQACQYGTFGDFWELDTRTLVWSQPPLKGKFPCARSGHHMISMDNKIYLFGGGLWDDTNKMWLKRYNDMFVYNTDTQEWSELTQKNPPRVNFISLPHWRIGTFIFTLADSLWCFDTITEGWTELPSHGAKPQKRFLGTAVKIPNKQEVYLFGGVYSEVVNYFDLLSWSDVSIYKLLRSAEAQNLIACDQGDNVIKQN